MNNNGYLKLVDLSIDGSTGTATAGFSDPRGITFIGDISAGWVTYLPTVYQGVHQRWKITSITNINAFKNTATLGLSYDDVGNQLSVQTGDILTPVAETTEKKRYGLFQTFESSTLGMNLANGALNAPLFSERNRIADSTSIWPGVRLVSTTGNDATADGSSDLPYATVNAALSAGGSVSIYVLPGSYVEDVLVSTSNVNVVGQGRVTITGSLSISGTNIGVTNINVVGDSKTALNVLNGSGSVTVTNANLTRSDSATNSVISVSGTLTGDVTIDNVNWVGVLSNSSTVGTLRIYGGGGTQAQLSAISSAGTTKVAFVQDLGKVTHSGGTLLVSCVSRIVKTGVYSIVSNAASASGVFLGLYNVGLQQGDYTYGYISKTGSCAYSVVNVIRDSTSDVLTGSKVSFGSNASDVYAAYSPSNYSIVDSSVEAHLEGIDAALLSLSETAGTTGPTGPQGPQGYQGTVGAQGASGAAGIPGSTGPQGPQGYQGAVGATGLSANIDFNGARTITRIGIPNVAPGGEDLVEFAEKFFYPPVPATVTLNSLDVAEIGETVSPAIAGTITLVPGDSLISAGIKNTSGTTLAVILDLEFSVSLSPVTSTTEYIVEVVTSNGTVTSSVTQAFAYPFLTGQVSNLISGSELFSGLASLVILKRSVEVAYSSTGYAYFAYPETYGEISSIVDSAGYGVMDGFVHSVESVTSSGLGSNWTRSYHVYRSTNVLTTDSYTLTFNFA